MTHDDLKELPESYVLGGLAGDERRAFEAHLKTCSECAADVRELLAVTEALGQLVEQRDPPATLRDRVFTAVRQGDLNTSPGDAPSPSRHAASRSWLWVAGGVLLAVGFYATSCVT